jgi:translation initiation factor IF-1
MPDTKKVLQEEGVVEEALPATTFKVRLKDNRLVHGYLAGKMRMYHIKIIPGDRVLIDFSPYDNSKGRISRRL